MKMIKIASILLAASFGIGMTAACSKKTASAEEATTYVSLRINPEVELLADEDGTVIASNAINEDGEVVLGDEVLTPDSSRFWPVEGYEAGKSQPSYDKQFVRDWLKANPDSDYDLPQDVIDKTIAKYKEAYTLLTGKEL